MVIHYASMILHPIQDDMMKSQKFFIGKSDSHYRKDADDASLCVSRAKVI